MSNLDKLSEQEPSSSYQCLLCDYVYHEAQGYKDDGLLPGTSWQDIPDDWCCPHCGASKEDFERMNKSI